VLWTSNEEENPNTTADVHSCSQNWEGVETVSELMLGRGSTRIELMFQECERWEGGDARICVRRGGGGGVGFTLTNILPNLGGGGGGGRGGGGFG
jgi:hypothetical protein